MELDYARLIVGYHGCDRSTVERVLVHGEPLRPSRNDWDWLGHGIYFWEYGPRRALEFAHEQKARGKVRDPDVLGAFIQLGRCLDLTDILATRQLAEFFESWRQGYGESAPVNLKGRGGSGDLLLRYRDCGVLTSMNRRLDALYRSRMYYQSVRGVFVEGPPVYEGAGFHEKTHVQVAIRDAACILGCFRPRPLPEVHHGDQDQGEETDPPQTADD